MSFGRLTNSFVSGTNENTVALANVNLDFALFKLEAPKEFKELGSSLSIWRRKNAEEGNSHQVARWLGALFEHVIPPTPLLVTAYGSRVSEIITKPGISPSGSRKDGPFEKFVGADGTSIWAAATSGPTSVSVHLLACMLARAWDAREAVAIWAELVAERKRELEAVLRTGSAISQSSLLASRQEISRKELGAWDASARAWLQSADEAMISRHKRLILIIKNLNVSITGGEATYGRVLRAWKNATTGMEKLLSGMPHEISDGAVMHALSAWHIFPDLVVLGSRLVEVKFKDALVPQGGVVTIGLQSIPSHEHTGITWSLALSHLRYYGDAIKVSSSGDSTRINADQLGLLVFGSLMGFWNVSQNHTIMAAQWFLALQQRVQLILTKSSGRLKGGHLTRSYLEWIDTLALAASALIKSEDDDRKICLKILNHGRRRGSGLIDQGGKPELPFFGLCSPIVQACFALEPEVERKIHYLRKVAQSMRIVPGQGIIRYTNAALGISEVITAVPHLRQSLKRQQDNSLRTAQVHVRWLKVTITPYNRPCHCKGTCAKAGCTCIKAGRPCTIACHEDGVTAIEPCHDYQDIEVARAAGAISRGELWSKQAFVMKEDDDQGTDGFEGENLPPLFTEVHNYASCFIVTGAPCQCHKAPHYCLCTQERKSNSLSTRWLRELINLGQVSLCASEEDTRSCSVDPSKLPTPYAMACVGSGDMSRSLSDLQEISDKDLMECLALVSGECAYNGVDLKQSFAAVMLAWPVRESSVESLRVISLVSKIYRHLSGATIPLSIVRLPVPLFKTKWYTALAYRNRERVPLTRASTFACVAMFESGGLDIDPSMLESVFAMSSGNSIFVSQCIISDPFELCEPSKIKRIVGNVGHAGITIMVPPRDPKVRPLTDDYMVISQEPYDQKRENNFQSTSLHMSFTGYELPLDIGDYGTIDSNLFIIETVISVRDHGVWVADVDILNAITDNKLCKAAYRPCHPLEDSSFEKGSPISIDSWEDLLDAPESVGIVRAHGNWIARLAATAVLARITKTGHILILGDKGGCWKCQSDGQPDVSAESAKGTTGSACLSTGFEYSDRYLKFIID
ncbi:hypothetical protein MMC30_004969 [Trapelia coarctata]|nr:hypothetical protein [Trapelia coarctata]